MIRINTSGCGWSITGNTYSCTGIYKLDPVFQHTPMDMNAVDNPAYSEVDRYDKIPQHIEGFVMTLSPIIDMSGGSNPPEVPELACRVNFDPFVTSATCVLNTEPELTVNPNTDEQGFVDLYNQVADYKAQFYVVSKSSAMVTGGTYHMTSEADFPVYGSTAIMAPGTLEPMLDTMFGPVDIDMPPTPDLTTDAIIYSLAGLQSWRHTIDTRVSDTYINAVDYGLLGLTNQVNQEGNCANFRISVQGNRPVQVVGTTSFFNDPDNIPTYGISGGTINLNGTMTVIPGLVSGLTASFTAYLDVDPEGTTASVMTVTTDRIVDEDRVVGHTYIYIGAVRPVQEPTALITGSTIFRLYEIVQGDCLDEVRTKFGDKNKDYPGPFVAIGTSPSFSVRGFDKEDSVDYAGKVYLDGKFLGWGGIGAVNTTKGTSNFIYAHVEVSGVESNTPTLVACSYDMTETFTPAAEINLGYTIRLARIHGDKPEQIHYGDIYLYTRGSGSGGSGYYTGPFHVISDDDAATKFSVRGVSLDGNNIAGKIFYNGQQIGMPSNHAVDGSSALQAGFVYAHIKPKLNTATGEYTVDDTTCKFESVAVSTWLEPPYFTIRLAQIVGSTDVIQFHYGDIYLYGKPGGKYDGPFAVSFILADLESENTSVMISGIAQTQVEGEPAGNIYINGASAGTLPVVLQKTVASTPATLYAHIGLKDEGDGTYSIMAGSAANYDTTSNTAITNADYTYHVRLAYITKDDVIQIQYGDIYIDMSPAVDAPGQYKGPFTLSDTSPYVTCTLCPKEGNNTVVGYYRLSGGSQHSVYDEAVSVTPAAGTTTNVYMHVTGSTTAVINTNTTVTQTPPVYTVWLGRLTTDANGNITAVDQVHYGEVLVDGRWL